MVLRLVRSGGKSDPTAAEEKAAVEIEGVAESLESPKIKDGL